MPEKTGCFLAYSARYSGYINMSFFFSEHLSIAICHGVTCFLVEDSNFPSNLILTMENKEAAESKSSLAEILDHSACAVCQCILRRSYNGDSPGEMKQSECRVYSKTLEAFGKQKQLLHSKEHQVGSTKILEGKKDSRPEKLHNLSPKQCFLGSSMYYGGPDEYSDVLHGRKEAQNEAKMAVNELEEAMDPFNFECTTRGNWWEGSLYY